MDGSLAAGLSQEVRPRGFADRPHDRGAFGERKEGVADSNESVSLRCPHHTLICVCAEIKLLVPRMLSVAGSLQSYTSLMQPLLARFISVESLWCFPGTGRNKPKAPPVRICHRKKRSTSSRSSSGRRSAAWEGADRRGSRGLPARDVVGQHGNDEAGRAAGRGFASRSDPLAGDFVYHLAGNPTSVAREIREVLRPLAESGIPTFAFLGNHDP